MTDITPRAGAPLLAASQAQKTVTHNEALYQFDALLCALFLDRDLTAPPSSPADGDTYLINAGATGAWTDQDGKIAYCADGAWRFYAPFGGLVAYVADETKVVVFNGTAWADLASLLTLQNVPLLGVNTTADSTNKLAVQANAALFTDLPTGSGGSGDIRMTLSKQASSNTASLLYQDAFSGRAEIGLAGDDDLHFKVSPDGAAWTTALTIKGSSGFLGVAQSAPAAMIDVLNGANTGLSIVGSGAASALFARYANTGGSTNIVLQKARGSIAAPLAGNVNDAIGSLLFNAYDGTAFQQGALVETYVDGTPSAGSVPTRLSFVTGSSKTASAENLTVKSNGFVGVNTTAPACVLDVNGPARVKTYTVATMPSAAAGAGQMIYVSDESGGAVIAFSDGTNWRRVTDRAVVS